MNKAVVFITIAVVIMGVLFSILSFMNFEPTTPYTVKKDSASTSQATTNLTVMTSNSSSITTENTTQQNLPPRISQSQLATHSSQTDCWVGYNGKAYDLTSWLPRHPGSAGAILPYCGTSAEFEQAFQKKHGTSKSSLFMKVAIYQGDLE